MGASSGTNLVSWVPWHGPWLPRACRGWVQVQRSLAEKAALCSTVLVASGVRAKLKPLLGVQREWQEQTDAFLLVYSA